MNDSCQAFEDEVVVDKLGSMLTPHPRLIYNSRLISPKKNQGTAFYVARNSCWSLSRRVSGGTCAPILRPLL